MSILEQPPGADVGVRANAPAKTGEGRPVYGPPGRSRGQPVCYFVDFGVVGVFAAGACFAMISLAIFS